MLNKTVRQLISLDREKKLLVFTSQKISEVTDLRNMLTNSGFTLYNYENVEAFRLVYEERLKTSDSKIAVIVSSDIYVPYDIRKAFYEVTLSAATLFPRLNADTIIKHIQDWDIISFAEASNYTNYSQVRQTEQYINETVLFNGTIGRYCQAKTNELMVSCEEAKTFMDWICVAKTKASIEYYAAMTNTKIDLSFVDEAFGRFIANGYSRLSSEVRNDVPPIITRTLSVIKADKNEKSALIVMDGMSLFDFKAVSRYFSGIDYDFACSFALIPTTTPISRQSLFSGKFPRELSKPFSLADEEKEFRANALSLGFANNQIEYLRGYDADISPLSKMVAIIINDVDEIVHGQRQGRAGMHNDMTLLGKSGKLQALIKRLSNQGFSIYITSDHGNTICTGVGGFRSGVEVESRSMRMVILKDFAEANALLTENASEYQGFYLDKTYRYYICKNGVSFDSKGETVMTHGGMSIDEVVVPFIKIGSVN